MADDPDVLTYLGRLPKTKSFHSFSINTKNHKVILLTGREHFDHFKNFSFAGTNSPSLAFVIIENVIIGHHQAITPQAPCCSNSSEMPLVTLPAIVGVRDQIHRTGQFIVSSPLT